MDSISGRILWLSITKKINSQKDPIKIKSTLCVMLDKNQKKIQFRLQESVDTYFLNNIEEGQYYLIQSDMITRQSNQIIVYLSKDLQIISNESFHPLPFCELSKLNACVDQNPQKVNTIGIIEGPFEYKINNKLDVEGIFKKKYYIDNLKQVPVEIGQEEFYDSIYQSDQVLLLFNFYFDEYNWVLKDCVDSLIIREQYLPRLLYLNFFQFFFPVKKIEQISQKMISKKGNPRIIFISTISKQVRSNIKKKPQRLQLYNKQVKMKITCRIIDVDVKYFFSCRLCALKKIHPECQSKKKIILEIVVKDETGQTDISCYQWLAFKLLQINKNQKDDDLENTIFEKKKQLINVFYDFYIMVSNKRSKIPDAQKNYNTYQNNQMYDFERSQKQYLSDEEDYDGNGNQNEFDNGDDDNSESSPKNIYKKIKIQQSNIQKQHDHNEDHDDQLSNDFLELKY